MTTRPNDVRVSRELLERMRQRLIDVNQIADFGLELFEILNRRALPADQQAGPVVWGSPKTVGQLIRQLQTLDPALETVALYRLPDDVPGVGGKVKQGHISTSYERMEGIWLGPYKGDGRKVLAFWTKLDPRPVPDGEFLTQTPPPDREHVPKRCECPVCWPDHPAHSSRTR
ncbi:hypothetical protein [Pseudomonas syringae group genomosp. 3]|uniref:hypothetical protein n=1 Tax=Pseudomonas syringae group genomosp. 3 TaxID=251701 RepID=UPI000A7CD854|nr:hypothetical protein [Pseudomonas syringae group genomosp. 3]